MYILVDIKIIVDIKSYIGTKTTLDYFLYKIFLIFNVKDFIF